jgi:dolichol-phosphate mannosyltransferase
MSFFKTIRYRGRWLSSAGDTLLYIGGRRRPPRPPATKHLQNPLRLPKFLTVGASGVLVNMGIYTCLVGLGVPPAYSSAASVEASVLSNFALNDLWTFRDRRTGKTATRLALFHLSRLAGAVVNVAAVALLTVLRVEPLAANAAGIVLGLAVNYYTSDRVVWRA